MRLRDAKDIGYVGDMNGELGLLAYFERFELSMVESNPDVFRRS